MRQDPTVVSLGTELRSSVQTELTQIKEVIERGSNCLVPSPSGGSIVTWAPEVARLMTPGKGLGNSIGRILLDASGRSELLGAGSGEITLHLSVQLALALVQKIAAGEDARQLTAAIQKDTRGILELTQVVSRWPKLEDVLVLLKQLSSDSQEIDLVTEAINMAGLEGRIFVNVCSDQKTSLELVQDFTFDLAPVPDVVNRQEKWSASSVKCAIIDGIVERVSEIHNILESASSSGQACILFCRGFTEEVIATLGLNRKRGTLNVIPVPVSFDVESANTLKDIASILNTDIVSSLQGNLISEIKWHDLPTAESVRCHDGVLSIRSGGSPGVAFHVADLIRRRSDLPADDRRKILDDRIRSLTPVGVAIRVGGIDAEVVTQRLDLMLRSVKAVILYGVVNPKKLLQSEPRGDFEIALQESMSNFKSCKILPAISIAAIARYSSEAAISIANTEAAVLLDL